MYTTQTQQLPVSHTQVDGSTFNNNLPAGNDVWPTLQMPRRLDPNLAASVVANFRTLAQTRSSKTNLHCFAYNLLSQNRFHNQLFQEWCQRAVDFAEFLAVAQAAYNTPPQIVEKASKKIYVGFLSLLASQYPALAQMLPQETLQGLNLAMQEFSAIQQDVANFQRQGTAVMGGQPFTSPGMAPPVTTILAAPAPASAMNVAAIPTTSTVTGTAGRGSALYLEQNPGSAIPQSWDASSPGPSNATIQPLTPPPTPVEEQVVVRLTLDEVKIDPYAYRPKDFIVDEVRKYDEIHAPGGVLIKPAHKTKWKRTAGDDQPYSALYNPQKYMLFYVRWPDGVVKEKLAEITPDMEYLRHEIDDILRRRALKPDGIMVPSTRGIVDNDEPPVPLQEQVEKTLDEHLDDIQLATPVLLDMVFTASTNMENEQEARNTVIKRLQLDTQDPVPAHEYVTMCFHPMEISEECYLALQGFKDYRTFEMGARKLKLLLESGLLSLRYYRFLNDRLTKGVNTFLRDCLSISKTYIDDFVSDIEALPEHLASTRGREVKTVLESSADTLFARYLNMASEESDEDGIVYGVVDEAVNFQLSWSEADLVSLNIEREPVLVSKASHPKVTQVIKGMVERASAAGAIRRRQMRLITADGVYLEIVLGRLVKDAVLLKRL